MDINILITQITILFLILLLGYVIYKAKMVDDNFVSKFTRLILDITSPALIQSSVLNLTERQKLSDVLTAFAIAFALFFVVLPIVGYVLARVLRVKKNQRGLYTYMTTFSNVGFMGFPVISAISGPVGLFYAAIFNLVFSLSAYTLGVFIISQDSSEKTKFNIKQLLTPGFIIIASSIFIYFLNIKPPALICDAVEMVGSITPPAAMLIIGCMLAKSDIKTVFNDWRLYPWIVIKQIVIPLLLWYPFNLIIKNELLLTVAFVLFAMPVGNVAALFSASCGADEELAARAIFLTTLFSVLTVPLCVWLVM